MGTDSWRNNEDVEPEPIEVARGDEAAFWSAPWVAWATLGFVALGVTLRLARYLLNFPLWCDETMIAANFLDRGYADLFRPLDYRQVSPLLFLAIELTAVKLLGFSELTLRLFPMLCGVASVPLFRHVAGRVVRGVPLLLAVAIFAVAGWPLRYVAEVKPYASDLFAALVLTAIALEWRRAPRAVGWLWALAAAMPVAVALSLPAVFVVGGVGIALVVPVWRSRAPGARLPLILGTIAAAATFLALARFYKTAPADHEYFHNAWAKAFPPLDSLPRLMSWLVDVHTGYMFAYPDGGARGASAVTFLGFATAAIFLCLRGGRTVAALCLAPFALALVAAALHRYPYGFSARTTQYAAPAICLLTGLGFAFWLSLMNPPLLRRRFLMGVTALLALSGGARLGLDLVRPYKTKTDQRVRAFAQWFWTELPRDSVVVCAHRDLGVTFDPRHWTRDATDAYLAYQKIYSPRHRRNLPADLSSVRRDHPLRVVLFNETPDGTPEFDSWLAGMLTHYDFSRCLTYPVSSLEAKIGATWDQLYVVYEFVPRSSSTEIPRRAESIPPVRR